MRAFLKYLEHPALGWAATLLGFILAGVIILVYAFAEGPLSDRQWFIAIWAGGYIAFWWIFIGVWYTFFNVNAKGEDILTFSQAIGKIGLRLAGATLVWLAPALGLLMVLCMRTMAESDAQETTHRA